MSDFKKNNKFEIRHSQAIDIIEKYPGRVPIIVEPCSTSTKLPKLDKYKFLVPENLTLGQFHYVIRKRISINPTQAIFILCKNNLLPVTSSIEDVYNNYKDDDNFLYFVYSTENTFG